ncbi:MAG: hypothetical protein P4L53_20460 [Candidatus Obscuribacterales bacterium]|nr:hypothetical protein [Candidatus Obscuribacterales bacterium]
MPGRSHKKDQSTPDGTLHRWEFKARFRRGAFGWKSEPAVARIKQAISEIKKVARTDQTLAAEGSVLFLERLSPALEHVDSSSGRIGSAVCESIEELVSIISSADVAVEKREMWLERLWQAMIDDEIPYIETLGDHWGDLCATTEIASSWADRLIDTARMYWKSESAGSYFHGTMPCLSALFKAKRYNELFELLKLDRHRLWDYQQFTAKVLACTGKIDEAIEFANNHSGWHVDGGNVAAFCEQILLNVGRIEEAYEQYAISANRQTSNLTTFRTIKKKYSSIAPTRILQDLIANSPGEEGKWFATAKELKQFDLAIKLAATSPCDPRTLMRASRDYRESNPDFAVQAGLSALAWLFKGHGYEITNADILEAYDLAMNAAQAANKEAQTYERILEAVRSGLTEKNRVAQVLAKILL